MSAAANVIDWNKFTPSEKMVLRALLEKPSEIVQKARLEELLYSSHQKQALSAESNCLQVFVNRIRRKLPVCYSIPRGIKGIGYRIEVRALCEVCQTNAGSTTVLAAQGTETFTCANCLVKLNPQELE